MLLRSLQNLVCRTALTHLTNIGQAVGLSEAAGCLQDMLGQGFDILSNSCLQRNAPGGVLFWHVAGREDGYYDELQIIGFGHAHGQLERVH